MVILSLESRRISSKKRDLRRNKSKAFSLRRNQSRRYPGELTTVPLNKCLPAAITAEAVQGEIELAFVSHSEAHPSIEADNCSGTICSGGVVQVSPGDSNRHHWNSF